MGNSRPAQGIGRGESIRPWACQCEPHHPECKLQFGRNAYPESKLGLERARAVKAVACSRKLKFALRNLRCGKEAADG
jgi:hypothetical protein